MLFLFSSSALLQVFCHFLKLLKCIRPQKNQSNQTDLDTCPDEIDKAI